MRKLKLSLHILSNSRSELPISGYGLKNSGAGSCAPAARLARGDRDRGSVNVLGGAPFGYRYFSKNEGDGEARYEIVFEEARVVQQVFEWVGKESVQLRRYVGDSKSPESKHALARLGKLGRLALGTTSYTSRDRNLSCLQEHLILRRCRQNPFQSSFSDQRFGRLRTLSPLLPPSHLQQLSHR